MRISMTTAEVLDWCRQPYNKSDDDVLAIINALAGNFSDTHPTGAALITCAIALQDNADEMQAQRELLLQDLDDRSLNTERGQMDAQSGAIPAWMTAAGAGA